MTTNLCPACGPVEAHLSSRYCMAHLKEFLARCLEIPAVEPRVAVPVARERRAA